MDVALSKLEHLRADTSPTNHNSSPEPLHIPPPSAHPITTTTNKYAGVMTSVHGAMLHQHGHDLLSKLHKVSYSSPPPIACSPENNVCKLIDYRGAKVAAFVVEGRELICLPQAFELFLKHLVGGLHTVYTKLKRLDITPVVCNVEQVRILRGLGAIQPGVNRCKLISCKEFDILYDDCTNSSARPGRPPKRSPAIHASPETIEKLKKTRFDGVDYYNQRLFGDGKGLLNGYPHHPYAMGPLPFMQLNHPLLGPPVTTLAMAQQLGLRHEAMMSHEQTHMDQERGLQGSDDGKSDLPSRQSDLPYNQQIRHQKEHDNNTPLNLHINGHHAEDLRKSPNDRSDYEDDDIDDENPSDDDKSGDSLGEYPEPMNMSETAERTPTQNQPHPQVLGNGGFEGFSSIETLLINIQGLLKVAADNARHHERQVGLEKAELKMELYQEKKLREEIEKQLLEEQRQKNFLQRRLKKERRARKRVEEQVESSDQRPRMFESPNGINSELIKQKAIVQEPEHKDRFGSTTNIPEAERNGQVMNYSTV